MSGSIKYVGSMVIETVSGPVSFQIGTEDERIAALIERIGDLALVREWQTKLATEANIHARLAASPFADRSPAQAYAFIEAAIDKWNDLEDAKRDLKEWLPLISIITSFLIERENA